MSNEYFLPNFKNGQYSLGINLGITQIISKLGILSQSERDAQELLLKKNKEEEDAKFLSTFIAIITIIAILSALIIIGFIIFNTLKTKRLKKELKIEEERQRVLKIERDLLNKKEYVSSYNKTIDSLTKELDEIDEAYRINGDILKNKQYYESVKRNIPTKIVIENWDHCLSSNFIVSGTLNRIKNDFSVNSNALSYIKSSKEKIKEILSDFGKKEHELTILRAKSDLFNIELNEFKLENSGYFSESISESTILEEVDSIIENYKKYTSDTMTYDEFNNLSDNFNYLCTKIKDLENYYNSLSIVKRDLEAAKITIKKYPIDSVVNSIELSKNLVLLDHVSYNTREEFNSLNIKFNTSKYDIENESNLIKKSALINYYLKSFSNVGECAKSDVDRYFAEIARKKEEERRRKKREEEEEKERIRRKKQREAEELAEAEEENNRKNRSTYSSNDSWNNTSNDTSFGSDFGGGSSGGGGDTGNW